MLIQGTLNLFLIMLLFNFEPLSRLFPLYAICSDYPLNLYLLSSNSTSRGPQSFSIHTNINTQTQTVHRARNPTISSSSPHPDTRCPASWRQQGGAAAITHPNLLSDPKGAKSQLPQGQSRLEKGRGYCLMWPQCNRSPADTITYVNAEPRRAGPP